MKSLNIKKYLALGLTLAGAALTPNLRADTTNFVFIEGGSASSSVILAEVKALFTGGTFVTNGSTGSFVYRIVGKNGTTPALSTVFPNSTTWLAVDVNLANGAIAGLNNLNSAPDPTIDTNFLGQATAVTVVDSATTPAAVGIDGSAFHELPTYVVPLVFAKNSSLDLTTVTNLTSRQALALESGPLPTTFFGGTSTNLVYFVGRNNNAAVRTEIDAAINNAAGITSYTNNHGDSSTTLGQATKDTNPTDVGPGLPAAALVYTNLITITNAAIGTVAVQNVLPGITPLNYEGVPYTVTNIINGSYALWGNEFYYYKSPNTIQQTVINQLYKQVTNNVVLQTSTYANKFVPIPWLKVTRSGVDGGPIYALPGY